MFHADGARFAPTGLARGPWDPGAQHGGAPSALLARAIERHEPGSATHVARLTIELLRPVPLEPLSVRARTVRPGRNVQIIEASLFAGDTEVARASGLRLREKQLRVPESGGAGEPRPSAPEAEAVEQFESIGDVSFANTMDIVTSAGRIEAPGPAMVWFRLRVPVVADEATTPLMRVAAAADFGNGISAVVDWNDGWLFINPDLTVYLHRYPVGEWVGLDAVTFPGPNGVGLAEAGLYDERGRIGRSAQALLLDRP